MKKQWYQIDESPTYAKNTPTGVLVSNENGICHIRNEQVVEENGSFILQAFNSTPFLNPQYIQTEMDDLLNSKITDKLVLSTQCSNCLRNSGCITIQDLINSTKTDLLRIPYLGEKSLNDITEQLSKLGLNLKSR